VAGVIQCLVLIVIKDEKQNLFGLFVFRVQT